MSSDTNIALIARAFPQNKRFDTGIKLVIRQTDFHQNDGGYAFCILALKNWIHSCLDIYYCQGQSLIPMHLFYGSI